MLIAAILAGGRVPVLLVTRRIAALLAVAAVVLGVALPFGCVIQLGTSESSSGGDSSAASEPSEGSESGWGASTSPAPPLPEPAVWHVDLPVLTPDQQARKEEVDQYLAQRYFAQGWQIVETYQTYLGDIIDWLDPASVEGSQEEPPPHPSPDDLTPAEGTALAWTEVDLFPELRVEGAIPVVRPSFAFYVSGLTGATSLEEFLAKYVVPGMPTGPNRLYAGKGSLTPNLGAMAWINAFAGFIEPGTMSLLEMNVHCNKDGVPWEQVGIAASRDWTTNAILSKNFGDWLLRLQVEFLTAGEGNLGHQKGGWVGQYNGFVPVPGPYAPGYIILGTSIVGGPQVEALYQIQLWKGNWWVGWNGTWLGYFPGHFFTLMASQACEASWYGEVFDPNATATTWTWTGMGSEQFASAGFGYASYFRNPGYVDTSGTFSWALNVWDFKQINPECYSTSELFFGMSPWNLHFYLGGEGGDAASGKCP